MNDVAAIATVDAAACGYQQRSPLWGSRGTAGARNRKVAIGREGMNSTE